MVSLPQNKDSSNIALFLFPAAIIPGLSYTLLSILNGFCGASADTGHAMSAFLSPYRFSAPYLNVI